MATTNVTVEGIPTTDYIMPVTHISLERVDRTLMIVMAFRLEHSRSWGLAVMTPAMWMRDAFKNLRERLLETSPVVKEASERDVPSVPSIDFSFDQVQTPYYVVNAQAYAIEKKDAVFIDFFSLDPPAQTHAMAAGGGQFRVGTARVAMSAGMFLGLIKAIEEACA